MISVNNGKTTMASFIKDPLKFIVGQTDLWPSTAKLQEGFAKSGHTKNPFG
tara:strand:+ start:224 stop:376 length:153 start_codon:yes stop_codon:yes gene_type:complete